MTQNPAPADFALYLFERHPQPMYVFDRETLAFLAVNDAAIAAYGWTRDEFSGMTLRDIRRAEYVSELEDAVFRQPADQVSGRPWRHLQRDGSEIWVEISVADLDWAGRPGRLVTAVNVTEHVRTRKETERLLAELQAERSRLQLIVEGSEQVFFYVHGVDGIFEYVSPSVQAVLGYSADELIGRHYDVLSGNEDTSEEVRQHTDAALSSGGTQPPYFAFTRHRDGRMVVVEVTESPVLRDGVVAGVQGFARDITVRRELETQLLQAQKMEAVGRLAGGIAHDFNNILTAIRGHAELLLAGVEDVTLEDDIMSICRGAERATSLTRQLLAFSRKQVLRPRPLDLGQVVDGLSSMLERLLGTDVALRTEMAPDLWPVRADPTQIEQVVLNLVMNARDAMQRGEITVSMRNVAEADAARPAGLPPGEYVELAVADTGHGIDPSALPHVFEPFFTTRADGEGTGLGLATVYGITKQSDGHIFVDTEPGNTVFRIMLHRVHEQPSAVTDTTAPIRTMRGTETILLAEDEDAVRALIARVLRRNGYTVLDAPSGSAALELSRQHAGRIHMLVTDIVMPGMRGSELATLLLEERPDVRVLFISGYAESMIDRFKEMNAEGEFLEKPFTPFDLLRMVRKVLDQ